MSVIYTVGHSNHTEEAFLHLLAQAQITALADVRSTPYSKRHSQFNREALQKLLQNAHVAYVFLGEQLGGRPWNPELYDEDGHIEYELVQQTDFFREGMDRLKEGMKRFTIAMMCAEADPLDCHRGLMITPALMREGIDVVHLHKDGNLESTAEMEQRLLKENGNAEGLLEGLFASMLSEEDRNDLVREAYRTRAQSKGYRRK